jgi:hypothetical protein
MFARVLCAVKLLARVKIHSESATGLHSGNPGDDFI